MKNKIAFLILISLIIVGCSYEFSSDNFIQLEPPSTTARYIELNNFTNLDTINVESTLGYTFNGSNNQQRVESNVYVDNQFIQSNWQNETATFLLQPSRYEDGVHTIRIEYIYTSGTGSIADQIGAELIKEIVEYQFMVNRKPSTPPEVFETNVIDGTIFISWNTDYETDYVNAYLSIKFGTQETRIPLTPELLALGSYNDNLTVLYVANTNAPNYNEFRTVTYSIVFESEYEELYGTSNNISYDPSSVVVKIGFTDFSSYKVKWSAHPQYANFENFEMGTIDGSFEGSSEGGEFLIQVPYVFGQEYSVTGRPKDTENNLPYYTFRNVSLDEETFGTIDLDPLFVKDILFNPNTNHYYALVIEADSQNNRGIYIYEYSQEMEYLRKTFIDNNVNRTDYIKFVFDNTTNLFYIDNRYISYKIDGNSLVVLEEFNSTSLEIQISARGQVFASFDFTNNQLTIVNSNSSAILYSQVNTGICYISPSGEYVFIQEASGGSIYRVENDALINVLDITAANYNFGQQIFTMQIVGTTAFYAEGNQIMLVNLITKESKSFEFGTYQQSLNYDEWSKKLLVSQSGYNTIYNTITEESVTFESQDDKSISGVFRNEDRAYIMHLQNGRLIHSKGIYIDIN